MEYLLLSRLLPSRLQQISFRHFGWFTVKYAFKVVGFVVDKLFNHHHSSSTVFKHGQCKCYSCSGCFWEWINPRSCVLSRQVVSAKEWLLPLGKSRFVPIHEAQRNYRQGCGCRDGWAGGCLQRLALREAPNRPRHLRMWKEAIDGSPLFTGAHSYYRRPSRCSLSFANKLCLCRAHQIASLQLEKQSSSSGTNQS